MRPGSIFGDRALIDPTAIRAASIITDRPSELIVLDRKMFWNLQSMTGIVSLQPISTHPFCEIPRCLMSGLTAINPDTYSYLSESLLFRHWPSKAVVHLSNSIPKVHIKSQVKPLQGYASLLLFISCYICLVFRP
jgi:hypothetical protein